MRVPIRKLNEREQKLLTPLITRYLQLQQQVQSVGQELERSLALTEPRFSDPGMAFDFKTLEFFEERAPAPKPATIPPRGDVRRRSRSKRS